MDAPSEMISAGPVRLRRVCADDLDRMVTATRTSWAHLRPWMPWAEEEPTPQSVRPYLDSASSQWTARKAFQFAMLPADGDEMVGACGLMDRIDRGGLEIGYWLHVDHLGRGLATNATAALACAGLRLASIDHVEIHCDADNAASRAVAARLGFEHVENRSVKITSPGESGLLQVWRLTFDRWPTSTAYELGRAHDASAVPVV